MVALASCAVALRESTGSERFWVESFEERMAEIEEAKAVGSLRFDSFLGCGLELMFEGVREAPESDSDDDSEEDAVDVCGSPFLAAFVSMDGVVSFGSKSLSSSESARLIAGNSFASSSEAELEDELE